MYVSLFPIEFRRQLVALNVQEKETIFQKKDNFVLCRSSFDRIAMAHFFDHPVYIFRLLHVSRILAVAKLTGQVMNVNQSINQSSILIFLTWPKQQITTSRTTKGREG